MMKKFFLSALCALSVGLLTTSCNDDNDIDGPVIDPVEEFKGAILLNEGTMGMNNASMTLYTNGQVVADPALSTLGDVANDAILAANGKVYATISSSKTLAIVDTKSLTSNSNICKQVSLEYQPRYLAEKDGYLYISCYGGTILKFNMATEKVEKELKMEEGQCLEGVAIVGNTLYVCNSYFVDESGNYNYLDQLMTIDLSNFTQGKTLTTAVNPNYLTIVDGKLFLLAFGDYYMNPYQIVEVDTQSGESTFIANASKMCAWGNKLLYAYSETDWSNWPDVSTNTSFGCYEPATQTLNEKPFAIMPPSVSKESIYFLAANPANGNILMGVTDYISTSTIHEFNVKGQHQNTFDSKGINTNKAIFIN